MPALQIRDLPEDVYEQIKQLSEKEHRSLSSQALVLLKKALALTENPRDRRSVLVETIEKQHDEWRRDLPEPADLIAEDRVR